jgi:ribosomal protein S18 acetylase RimI-like enzyme
MKSPEVFKDILIRTEIVPGDIGYVIHMHGRIYKKECGYGLDFESYVASGLHEFVGQLPTKRTQGWVCERDSRIVGFLALMDRGEQAQLRYFVIDPSVRGMGLGKKLMELFMDYLKANNYKGAFLLTTKELPTAAHLYTSHGFVLKDERATEYPFGKPVVEQRYELTL